MTSHAQSLPSPFGGIPAAGGSAVRAGERAASGDGAVKVAVPSVAEAMSELPLRRLLGRVVTSARPEMVPLTTPLTGEEIAQLPLTGVPDVEFALEAARATQRGWQQMPMKYRQAVALTFHDLLLEHQDMLLDLVQLETGKTRRHALEELIEAALVVRHYGRMAGWYLRTRVNPGMVPLLSTVRETSSPLGVVGVVVPWNRPLAHVVRDVIPALLAGNTVVLRPHRRGALTALAVADLLAEANLPDGVVQVVVGDRATTGQAVLDGADFAVFTGSAASGRAVAASLGERLVGASLEVGGKNCVYVADDADLALAVPGVIAGCFTSAGQAGMSAERLIVHEAVAEEFVERLVPALGELRLGAGLAYGAQMGTLGSAKRLETVQAHVADAVALGATVLAGGHARPDVAPWAFEPTLLGGVTPAMRAYREETFGPVVSVFVVGSDAEAVRLANDVDSALTAGVWTTSPTRGRTLARALRVGVVTVNEGHATGWSSVAIPLSGVRASGYGAGRHGQAGIRRFTRRQAVAEHYVPAWGVSRGRDDSLFARCATGALRVAKALRLS